MSLFGSIYEEAGGGTAAPGPTAAPDAGPPAGSPFDLEVGEPVADGAGAPSMSLQEFAAEVFGTRGEAEPAGQAAPSGAPAPGIPETALATLPPSEDEGFELPTEVNGLETGDPSAGPDGTTGGPAPLLEVFSLIDDDLLPATNPARGVSLPSLPGLPGLPGGRGRVKTAAVLLAALLVGFLGYRTFAPGGDPSDASPPAGGGAGGRPMERVTGAVDAAQLTAVQAELTAAAVMAQAHFAETGTFALSAEEWDQRVPAVVVASEAPPVAGTLQVVSDGDAACFQTATRGGTTVAAGVTGDGVTFASDGSGAALCTLDAADLAAWAPALEPLAPLKPA